MVWSVCLLISGLLVSGPPISAPPIFVVIVCRWCRVCEPLRGRRARKYRNARKPAARWGAGRALPGSGSPIYPVIAVCLEDLGRVSPPCGRISTKIHLVAGIIRIKWLGRLARSETRWPRYSHRGQKATGLCGQSAGRALRT